MVLTQSPGEISFRNAAAVRVGFVVAGMAFFLSMLSAFLGSTPLQLFILGLSTVGAGFVAVYLYHRRTGEYLTVRSGAKLGFMTGVFGFVLSTVMFTITMISMAGKGGLAELYRQQSSGLGMSEEVLDQMIRVLESPAGVAMFILFALMIQFVLGTGFASVGGALGAKVLEEE